MEHFDRSTLLNEIFTQEDVDRSRRYHRPLYGIRLAELGLGVVVPLLLAVFDVGDAISLSWWLKTFALTVLVPVTTALARLPFAIFRFRHERAWGFSTQSVGGWIGDRAKGLAIGIVLSGAVFVGLVGAARMFPDWWPLVAAVAAALFVALLTFVAPIVLEPIFNRFRPLADERLAARLRTLAERAGVPVRDVLVSDASRRTRKHNAYVSGLGRTRRVVLWDTLLDRAAEAELEVVVAHELGHRRFRHVAWGTALGMAGAAFAVVVLWGTGADVGDPDVVPIAMALFAGLELAALPPGAALSRRFERAADRFSIDLTGAPDAYERLHLELARENVADLDPPRAYHLALHGHPTPPDRIAAGRAWKAARPRPV
jgi:STE24 endopeptidase